MTVVVDSATELATFGRTIARAQGFDPATPGFDAVEYGKAARYGFSRKPPQAPDPRDYVTGGVPQPPPLHHERAVGGADTRPRVRIGRIEMRLSDEPPAVNRPQHHLHRGQRSSGRYRLTHRNLRWRYRRRK